MDRSGSAGWRRWLVWLPCNICERVAFIRTSHSPLWRGGDFRHFSTFGSICWSRLSGSVSPAKSVCAPMSVNSSRVSVFEVFKKEYYIWFGRSYVPFAKWLLTCVYALCPLEASHCVVLSHHRYSVFAVFVHTLRNLLLRLLYSYDSYLNIFLWNSSYTVYLITTQCTYIHTYSNCCLY